MYTVVLAAIAVVVCNATLLRLRLNVPAEAAVFVIAILLTTVVVEAGTVYKVPDVVANAARASALVVVAMIYYLSFRGHPS